MDAPHGDADPAKQTNTANATIEIGVGEPLSVDAGPLRFHVRRRDVGSDGGVSVELYRREDADAADPARELVRFDLFRGDPHYHVPASAQPRKITPDLAATPLDFAAAQIETLPDVLREAGFDEHARALAGADCAAIAAAVRDAAARAPEPSRWSTFEITPEIRRQLDGG